MEKHEPQTEFALTRLGKKLGFGVSHKVLSYQTLDSDDFHACKPYKTSQSKTSDAGTGGCPTKSTNDLLY